MNKYPKCKLPKKIKLKHNSDFQAVYKAGRSFANKMAVLYVVPAEAGKGHIGFAAGKRLGCAVVRNRVKRLLREAYRLNQNRICQDYDLILVGRQRAVGADYASVAKAFMELCSRARILK
jgi:ribonuclease P protein component